MWGLLICTYCVTFVQRKVIYLCHQHKWCCVCFCVVLTSTIDSTSQFTRQGIQPFPVNVRETEWQNDFEFQPNVQMDLSHLLGIRQNWGFVSPLLEPARKTLRGIWQSSDSYYEIITSTLLNLHTQGISLSEALVQLLIFLIFPTLTPSICSSIWFFLF